MALFSAVQNKGSSVQSGQTIVFPYEKQPGCPLSADERK